MVLHIPYATKGLSLSGTTSQPQAVGTNPMTLPTWSEERHLCHQFIYGHTLTGHPASYLGHLMIEVRLPTI